MANPKEDLISFDELNITDQTEPSRPIPGQRIDYRAQKGIQAMKNSEPLWAAEPAPTSDSQWCQPEIKQRKGATKPYRDDHKQWSTASRNRPEKKATEWVAGDVPKKLASKDDDVAREVMKRAKLEHGKHLGEDIDLCPWKQCVEYVNNYIGKRNSPRAMPYFEEILDGRTWDFFYLHNVVNKHTAWLLVPTYQFVDFLDHVNASLDTSLTIPRGGTDLFRIKFGTSGPFRPRYSHTTTSKKAFEENRPKTQIPKEDREAYNQASAHEKDKISQRLQRVVTRSPASMKRLEDRGKDMARMLEETQGMLGLKGGGMDEREVVFVSIDFEALERRTNVVSEVGIAVLDTRDIKGVDPGSAGSNWWELIKAFHLRVKEYSGLRNYIFVQGCPDAFDFGKSTFPSRFDVRKAILEVLRPWYGPGTNRNLVVVGHNVGGDLKYLSSVGVDVDRLNFIRQADTQPMHQVWRKLSNGRSLNHVLADLCIASKNLHNAGNDAVYTMRAVLGLAVESLREEECVRKGEKFVPALLGEVPVESTVTGSAEGGEGEPVKPKVNMCGYVD